MLFHFDNIILITYRLSWALTKIEAKTFITDHRKTVVAVIIDVVVAPVARINM